MPDAQSRLSYIARLAGEAAEKVLCHVEPARARHSHLAAQAQRVKAALVRDPVAAAATGSIMSFLDDDGHVVHEADAHLTNILMAQDSNDLTGQVIARQVALAATMEEQLAQLVIQIASRSASAALETSEAQAPSLAGPVVNSKSATDVLTDPSQVDDLLTRLGF